MEVWINNFFIKEVGLTKWEITFDGITYECINCGYCCSCKDWRIYLSYFDALKLKEYAEYIEKTGDINELGFTKRLKINKRGCVFLNKDKLCNIQIEKGYDFKPTMCKLFPFSFMVKWNGDLLLIIKHYCNGIKKGKCDDKIIKHAIECCEELYLDELDKIRLIGMESSAKTRLNKDTLITWEEREELGRYIFDSSNLDELSEKCWELLKLNISKETIHMHNNIHKLNLKSEIFIKNEKEIIRYLGELNKREHFRKLNFKKEICYLINIGKELSKYPNVFRGEGIIDSKILNYNIR
ncbi:YkgJ family cysteine cluster protein [Methanothermococcus sp.]|uniref:YkgJ family cysteine cluster protein n=1 Tax=Methanothermococcus sp. TaxID=2614238 RepID=UPI0025E062C9|nr:YkgJ family cysteine cluster protein [Methanothermococcus sp.]